MNPILKKLGYDENARVVILHADDIGMCQASVDACAGDDLLRSVGDFAVGRDAGARSDRRGCVAVTGGYSAWDG